MRLGVRAAAGLYQELDGEGYELLIRPDVLEQL